MLNPSRVIIGLLLLNAIFLFIPGSQLAEGARVFYWQRYNNYLYQLRCLIFIMAPIAIGVAFWFWQRQVRTVSLKTDLVAPVILFIFCLFINYSSLFILSYVTPVGTVKLNEHVYHLARYDEYDSPTVYYLGECDQSGYWCFFNAIYEFFMYDPGTPQITVSDSGELLLIKMGSDTVYTYDGKEDNCIDEITDGWCVEASP
jgi:hypothetical protein